MNLGRFLKDLFSHKHSFDMMDVVNLKIDPKCKCGKTLSQCNAEIEAKTK